MWALLDCDSSIRLRLSAREVIEAVSVQYQEGLKLHATVQDAVMARVASRWRSAGLAAAFDGWRFAATEQADLRQRLVTSIQHARLGLLAKAYRTWLDAMARNQASVPRLCFEARRARPGAGLGLQVVCWHQSSVKSRTYVWVAHDNTGM